MPSARSWLETSCSWVTLTSLITRPASRPNASCGATTIEGWKPVSTSTLPAPGCSTRNATTGTSVQPSLESPTPSARSDASRPSCRCIDGSGEMKRPQRSGRSRTVASGRPPASGREAGRGSAAVAIGDHHIRR